jgi:hypothetical protein
VKATAVSERFDMDIQRRPCIVCGHVSHPFGYVNKGTGQVCSKACDQRYSERQKYERSNEAVRPVWAVA